MKSKNVAGMLGKSCEKDTRKVRGCEKVWRKFQEISEKVAGMAKSQKIMYFSSFPRLAFPENGENLLLTHLCNVECNSFFLLKFCHLVVFLHHSKNLLLY